MTFVPRQNLMCEFKSGELNGHQVRTAHVKGTDVYRVIVDEEPQEICVGVLEFAHYLHRMTMPKKLQSAVRLFK